jgi:hypothetical protein
LLLIPASCLFWLKFALAPCWCYCKFSIKVAARSKAHVGCHPPTEIAGSNPTGSFVCLSVVSEDTCPRTSWLCRLRLTLLCEEGR